MLAKCYKESKKISFLAKGLQADRTCKPMAGEDTKEQSRQWKCNVNLESDYILPWFQIINLCGSIYVD